MAVVLLAASVGVRAQAPHPFAVDIPDWFAVTFLELPEDVRDAARDGKRVMVYFGQDGCGWCRKLMEGHFRDPGIVATTRRHFVPIALNILGDREVQWVDGRRMTEKELTRALGIRYTPTLFFFDEKGAVVARVNGYLPSKRFAAALDYAAGRAGRGQSFEEYLKRVPADIDDTGGGGTQVE